MDLPDQPYDLAPAAGAQRQHHRRPALHAADRVRLERRAFTSVSYPWPGASATTLGQAGNFAYCAIGTIFFPNAVLDAEASAYSILTGRGIGIENSANSYTVPFDL